MKRSHRAAAAAVALVAASGAGVAAATIPAVASAATVPAATSALAADRALSPAAGQTVAETKKAADEAIDKRLEALGTAIARIAEVKAVTAEHRATLTSDLTGQRASLVELRASIDAATTVAELRTLVPKIVHEHYVFAFQLPRAHLVVASDEITAASGRLTTLAGRLQARIDAEKAKGRDVSAAQAAVDDMTAKTSSAASVASTDGPRVLALQLSGFPGNRSVLESARSDLGEARRDLGTARHDAAQARAALEAARS